MAQSGEGTDACLRQGALPMLVHFYSPVPDIDDLHSRRAWSNRSELPGIDFRQEEQLTLLSKLGAQFGAECDWPPHSDGDAASFYTENNSFSYGCAAITHAMIRHSRPRKVIEIGSGNSSKVIAAAIRRNTDAGQGEADYTIIDPYPGELVAAGIPGVTRLVEKRVELVDISVFTELAAGDILFIDSGHTVRIGGDVNYEFLEVLPRLAPGVIVHIHDIPLPYEYPEVYATNPSFRVFWTESYLLQAFLCGNSLYEVLLGMSYIMTEQNEAFRAAFPLYDPQRHLASSGSFWMRRVVSTGEDF
ncbi:MAG: class I SAM-dependent methyltransferase [bacterium]